MLWELRALQSEAQQVVGDSGGVGLSLLEQKKGLGWAVIITMVLVF